MATSFRNHILFVYAGVGADLRVRPIGPARRPAPTLKSIRSRFIKSVLVALFCCTAFAVSTVSAAPTTSPELETIRQFFLQSEYERVTEKQANLDPEASDDNSFEAMYYIGVSLIKVGRPADAEALLTQIVERNPGVSYLDKIQVRIADGLAAEEKFEEALEAYQRVIDTYPQSASLPHAYEEIAKIGQKLGQFEVSKKYFDLLETLYPLSFEAVELRRRVTEKETHYGVQVGAFADALVAEKLKAELEQKGFSPYISILRKEDTVFYRVRLGQFSARREAEIFAQDLEAQGYSTTIFP